MSKREPTSTPWVGSSARITSDSPREERARERDLLLVAARQRTAPAARSTPPGCCSRRTRSSTVRALAPAAERSRGGRSRRSTWIVAFARTLRTGKSDSRARSPLSSTTPARSGPSGDLRRSSSLAVAAAPFRSIARRRRGPGGTAPARCPRRPAMPTISPSLTLEVDRPEPIDRCSPAIARSVSLGASVGVAIGKRELRAAARSSARPGPPPTSRRRRTFPG